MNMKKKIKYLLMGAAMLMSASCAELFEDEVEIVDSLEAYQISALRLSHNQADMLVGDSLIFTTEISPDTVEATFKWTLSDSTTQVVRMIGRRLYARNRGQVTVYVQAFPPGQSVGDVHPDSIATDSCLINVIKYDEVSSREFPYEMVFIAQLEVADTIVTDSLHASRLVALVDNEVRGRAVMRKAYGIPYLEMRIGSRNLYGEKISFEYYDPSHYMRHEFPSVPFDGATHGTLSAPVVFRINEPEREDEWRIERGELTIL